MSQEELLINTKLLIQGLEALKHEHNSILTSLHEVTSHHTPSNQSIADEKQNMVKKSLDMIDLGLGEAQVNSFLSFSTFRLFVPFKVHSRIN